MNALDRAVSYLSIRARSTSEVREYLKTKGYEEEEIRTTIDQLLEYNYLNDFTFAKMYIQYGFDKGRGQVRIKNELIAKGVDSNTIEDAFYELEDENAVPDQYEIALQIGRDVVADVDMTSLDYNDKKKIQARVGRRLATRGFNTDIVYRVIKNL